MVINDQYNRDIDHHFLLNGEMFLAQVLESVVHWPLQKRQGSNLEQAEKAQPSAQKLNLSSIPTFSILILVQWNSLKTSLSRQESALGSGTSTVFFFFSFCQNLFWNLAIFFL